MTSRVEQMNDRSGVFRNANFDSPVRQLQSRVKDCIYDGYAAVYRKVTAGAAGRSLVRGMAAAFEKIGTVVVKIIVVLAVVFIVCPIPIVIICSFSSAKLVYFPPPGFTVDWYLGLPEQTEYIKSFLLSLRLALVAVAISLLVGTMGAIALTRLRFRFTNLLKSIFLSPMMVPAVILGLAWVRFAALIGWSGSFQALLIVHVIVTIAYVVRTVLGALVGFDASIEEAARDLGASPWKTFWKVTFPMIRPSIIVAGLFAFITSLDETSVSVFLSGGQTITLPVRIFSQLEYGLTPTITAISSLLIIFAIIILVLIDRLIGLNKFKI